VVYDVEDLGGGILHGIGAIRDAAQSLGDQNPLGHHATNVVVESLDDDTAVHAVWHNHAVRRRRRSGKGVVSTLVGTTTLRQAGDALTLVLDRPDAAGAP
jgi:hypothetical protein